MYGMPLCLASRPAVGLHPFPGAPVPMPCCEGPQPPFLSQSLAVLMTYQSTDALFYGSSYAHL